MNRPIRLALALALGLSLLSAAFLTVKTGKIAYGDPLDMPVEMVISRRMSVHYGDYYNLTSAVPWDSVSKVLWAAYGYTLRGKTAPTLSDYPIIIYLCNETAAYKFIPENRSLILWKQGDYRGLSGGYPAPIQLYIAFDTHLCQDAHWGNAESGCAIQNIYLMANTLNLGTVCEGGLWLDRTSINEGLSLPSNEEALYKMPLGYTLPPYTNYQNLVPTIRPSSSELPEIQDTAMTLEDALDSVFSSHEWSQNPLTKQELSQVLWASYGYSYLEDTASSPPKRHRTVPSADSYYPMRIYAANSSGVYQYLPEQHTLTTIITEDRRQSIAQASGNPWASSAPLIIATAWDDTRILTVNTTYIEVGLITQNVYLESAAWGLIADWGKADSNEQAMRQALGLTSQTNLHPASIITVGHPSGNFNLTIASSEGGTTSPLPGTYSYPAGTSVEITAAPSSGYSFDHWLLDGQEMTENPKTLVMNDNHTIEAFFIDNIPPEINLLGQEPSGNVLAYQNVTVTVNVTDSGSGVSNVTLSYTVDNGTSWNILNMTEASQNAYETTIPGHEDGTFVMYKIIASDNIGNQAVNNNNGYYYVYNVIPELQNLTLTLLTLMTLTFAIAAYKRKLLRAPYNSRK